MSQSARVHSLDALKALHAALARYGPEAQEALGAAEMEIRRVIDSLHDQLKHWRRQVEKRQEDVNRARADLAHARSIRQGERSGYVEQEIALRKAQMRLREAEDKVVTVKRWLLQLPQAIHEYEGPARRLAGLLDADLKQGLALLQDKIDLLEEYLAVQVAEPPPAPQGETS
jgi:chromosome segregation ATPase